MLSLTNEELINVYGGAKLYIAPTYDLFMKLLSEENYEELHNLYSIDEIERNMNLEKERRKWYV